MRYLRLKVATALVGTVMATQLAQAAVITQTDTHALSITDWFDTLSVAQFDASQGTLNSVSISFAASMVSDMTLDNDNATATMARGTIDVQTIGTFAGLGSLGVVLSANTGFQPLGADDSGDTDLPGDGGPDEIAVANLMADGMLSALLTSGDADFAGFIGTGDVSTIGLGTFGGFSVLGGGGNVDVNANTQAAATLSVKYDFTPTVPPVSVVEPGTLALMGTGLIGMLGLRGRRRHS